LYGLPGSIPAGHVYLFTVCPVLGRSLAMKEDKTPESMRLDALFRISCVILNHSDKWGPEDENMEHLVHAMYLLSLAYLRERRLV